jgi:hypothetical protein
MYIGMTNLTTGLLFKNVTYCIYTFFNDFVSLSFCYPCFESKHNTTVYIRNLLHLHIF